LSISPIFKAEIGVSADGLSTTALPAAIAGAT